MGLETVVDIDDFVATNPTGADPKSQGDDHIRYIKTALLNDFAGFTGAVAVAGTDGGAVNAYTLTPTHALVAYGTKMLTVIAPTATNTGACTLNISGLGVKDIKSISGAALTSGDLVSGSLYLLLYTGTEFRLTGITKNYADQLAFSAALPSQTGNAGKRLETDGTNASWEDDPDYDQFTPVAMAALDVDCSLGNYFTKTIAGDSTFTFSNIPTAGFSFTLELTHTSGAVTLPASVKVANDTMPTLTTGKTHLFMFVTKNGGTRWRLTVAPNFVN